MQFLPQINKHNTHYWSNAHWKLQNEAHATKYLTVGAAIGWSGLVSLDISKETMNATKYCEILEKHIVLIFLETRQCILNKMGLLLTTR